MKKRILPQVIRTTTLTPDEAEQIHRLWNEEYPTNLANCFKLLLEGVTVYHHYLIKNKAGDIIGWAVDFEKDSEIRFSIIVHASQQGKGYGRILLDSLKAHLPEFYGWVIDHGNDVKTNGKAYRTPMPFYLRHGFEVLADQRIETDIISAVKIKWKQNC